VSGTKHIPMKPTYAIKDRQEPCSVAFYDIVPAIGPVFEPRSPHAVGSLQNLGTVRRGFFYCEYRTNPCSLSTRHLEKRNL